MSSCSGRFEVDACFVIHEFLSAIKIYDFTTSDRYVTKFDNQKRKREAERRLWELLNSRSTKS
jgi:hypothetical protein